MREFDLIKHYFAAQTIKRTDVLHGIGDDAAVIDIKPGHTLAVTTDTLVAGVHFPTETTANDIGYKSLAVNLSDLAAMGATPAWITLAITLPKSDETWIKSFCEGFFTLANQYQVQLIGGDLTQGPLSITVQAIGYLPDKQGLLRSAAQPGDFIYVTGTLGDAGLALRLLQQKASANTPDYSSLLRRLNRPEPRIRIGQQLLGLAHAAIDISDGLAADLSHILEASHVGAKLFVDQLPFSNALMTLPQSEAIALALTAGDDYELCFTIPAAKRGILEQTFGNEPCRLTCIGKITDTPGLKLFNQHGNPYHGTIQGYEHF